MLSSSEINMGHINSVKVNNKMPDEDDNIYDNSAEDIIEIPENDIDLFSLIEKEFSESSSMPEEETVWSSNFDNAQNSPSLIVTSSETPCIAVAESIVNSPQTSLIFSPGFSDPFLCSVTSSSVKEMHDPKMMMVSRN